jgi:threonine synthase
MIAANEGLFVEPASAAAVAGLLKLEREGRARGGRAVAIMTGNGLKDPETAMTHLEPRILRCRGTADDVRRAVGL